MRTLTTTKRPRYSAEDRRRFLAKWRESDQTQAEFAGAQGIRLGTLRRWLYRGQRLKPKLRRVALREVTPPEQTLELLMSPAVEIAVGPEITVRLKGVCDPEVVGRLVERLRRSC